jgi:hypothetical protein
MGGDIGRCLLVTSWGLLPASLGREKQNRFIAGCALGGDAVPLLQCVPEEVAMFAVSWALRAALVQHTHATLKSLAASLELDMPSLSP